MLRQPAPMKPQPLGTNHNDFLRLFQHYKLNYYVQILRTLHLGKFLSFVLLRNLLSPALNPTLDLSVLLDPFLR